MQEIEGPGDVREILVARREETIFGPEDTCVCKITCRKKLISEETRVFVAKFSGVDTHPESLCVLANRLIEESSVGNKIRSECIFLVRNVYSEEDVKVTICVPGTLSMVSYDSKLLEKPIVCKETIEQSSCSSIIRYLYSLFLPSKARCEDPFKQGYPSFKAFLSQVLKFQSISRRGSLLTLNYQEMPKQLGNVLHLVALFVNRMKLHPWVLRYCNEETQTTHLSQQFVHFLCETFAFSGDSATLRRILSSQKFNPLWTYYLSLVATKDQQAQILKKLTYLNKTQVWLFLAECYINYHITNLEMISKGLHILNLLSDRKNTTPLLTNPYHCKLSSPNTHTILQRDIFALPVMPRVLLVKANYKPEDAHVRGELDAIREQVVNYFDCSWLQRVIVRKIALLVREIGFEKTEQLFPKVFEQEFKSMDPLQYTPKEETELEGTSRPSHHEQQEQNFQIPSFAQQSAPILTAVNLLSTATASSTNDTSTPQLWSIAEQVDSPRSENKTSILRFDPIEYCRKKYPSSKLIKLMEIALDLFESLNRVLEKLDIKPSHTGSIKTLKLSVDDLLVVGEALQIFEMSKMALMFYHSARAKIFDTYSTLKQLRLFGKAGEFSNQLLAMNQLILDSEKCGTFPVDRLPLWVEEHLFSTLQKKGRVFVEALLSSSSISHPSISRSILKYSAIRNSKESFLKQ